MSSKSTTDARDEDLAARAARGDRTAFRTLLERHYDRVFRTVYSVLRHRSDAEDVTQEIWAAMPRKLQSWRGDAQLTSWLHRIAINAARDALRRAATRTRTTAAFTEVDALSRGADADTHDRLAWLQTALGTLSDDLRMTAALTLSDDMTHAQAADVLGVAEGTIAWRMSEIRKQLRSLAADRDTDSTGKEALA